ncbi:helix-turn-helix transcriptional regulator [Parendozoicomonas haliclonae]|uniref:Prophage CP4-57 regulatory protein (AlpA) n=1 Tax=Parendozoicomonas haliclonae TaxID=1960125 RepID=A0A1X7AJ96_9GAMM|nr:AlpA family phage regulatory protein [Parendozoicomonas haliclonae]SMA45545.1 Prophage CP4-57 regulatory protein (AlpA) [Parendozoicomonas haliclonae]
MADTDSKPALEDESVMEAVLAAFQKLETAQVRFVRRQFIEDTFDISRTTIYRLMAGQQFPEPIILQSNKGARWVLSELIDWAKERMDARKQS